LTFPASFSIFFLLRLIFIDSFNPICQANNRGDMSSSTFDEETFKYLIEKCDMYDNIDAILDLKDKYTLYELDQVQKERRMKGVKVAIENLEKLKEKTHQLH
jgi:hypothetical protein